MLRVGHSWDNQRLGFVSCCPALMVARFYVDQISHFFFTRTLIVEINWTPCYSTPPLVSICSWRPIWTSSFFAEDDIYIFSWGIQLLCTLNQLTIEKALGLSWVWHTKHMTIPQRWRIPTYETGFCYVSPSILIRNDKWNLLSCFMCFQWRENVLLA